MFNIKTSRGQVIKLKQKITKYWAIYAKEEISPITVFEITITADFSKVKLDDDIVIKVIGIRYELNDENILLLIKN